MTAITSGETVETVAHDLAAHVFRRTAVFREELDTVPGSSDVIAMNWIRLNRWLEKVLLDAEDAIADKLREHTTPRTVTTDEGVEALLYVVGVSAEPAHVRDRTHRHWLITEDEDGDFWAWSWREEGDRDDLQPRRAGDLPLPLTVLHEPEEATP